MALVTCKECRSQVSTQAKSCPKCGAPVAASLAKPRSMFAWLVLPLTAVAVIWVAVESRIEKRDEAQRAENERIADNGLKAVMTPAEFAEYKQRENEQKQQEKAAKEDAEAMKTAKHIALLSVETDVKRLLKDPDSARFGARQIHPNAKAQTGFTACGYVNAKNSLGGYTGDKGYIVTDRQPRIEDGSESFALAWKTLCF